MHPKRKRTQQNAAAGGIALLLLLAGLLLLFGTPRPGMLDTGQYDLILPQLGLSRGDAYTQAEYYTRPNELFAIDSMPWSGLLQVTSAPALVYPASLVSAVCGLFGQPFSTVCLAVLLLLLLSAAVFVLTKSLYALFGGLGVFFGGIYSAGILCGNYLLYLNSLYPTAMFLVALTAFAAAVFRGWALLRQPEARGVSIWLPAALCGLLLLTASEFSIVLLLPVVVSVAVLGFRTAKCSPRFARRTACVVLAVLALAFCSVRFTAQNAQEFNKTNLYHSFFDGVLLAADDPAQVLTDFNMDTGLTADIGKSAYLSEDAYYISPNGDRANEIFDHLSYTRIVTYYTSHPAALLRLTGQILPQAGHVDTARCVAVDDASPLTRADYWDLLRRFLFETPAAFAALSLACVLLGVLCLLRRRPGLMALLWLLPLSGWALLFAALVSGGTAGIEENRIPFQLFCDLQVCAVLTFIAFGIQSAVRCIAYSPLSARKTPEPIFEQEPYAPLPLAQSNGFTHIQNALHGILADSKRFALASALVCLLVMTSVLFFPRIGAYNNGDFGRMMDAMGLVYTPEDYFDPAVQYEKVIENYDYLEPYDWTRIRPGNMELTQSWISAGMRMLYDLAGVPFSTATLAVFHLILLTLCIYRLFLAAHRHFGKNPALFGVVLYLVLFCGSYNLGWLNSLFGEGIAFIGLMCVLASSVQVIDSGTKASRRFGLFLLVLASAYLACAKAQYAVLAPVLLIWWAALAISTSSGLKARLLNLAAAAVVISFIGVCCVGVYTHNESISSQDTLYSGLMNGILLYADDPEEALTELGLDPALAADAGKHPYLSKDEYYCPPRTEMAEKMIYSKVSSTDYLFWYLRHPKAFWALLNDTAEASAEDMPNFNMYIGEYNNVPHRTVHKFDLWAQIRPSLTPHRFALYILIFGASAVFALVMIFRRKTPKAKKLFAELLLVLMALGALQYPLPMVGNGHSDPIKQLYLFREVYDMVFLLLSVWFVFHLFPWLRGKLRTVLSGKLKRKERVQNAGA